MDPQATLRELARQLVAGQRILADLQRGAQAANAFAPGTAEAAVPRGGTAHAQRPHQPHVRRSQHPRAASLTRNAVPTLHRKLDRKPGRPSTASRSISRAGVHAPTVGLPFNSWRAQSSESAAVDEYPGGVSIQPSTSSPRRLRTRAQTTER